jgi:hypothetical protein
MSSPGSTSPGWSPAPRPTSARSSRAASAAPSMSTPTTTA